MVALTTVAKDEKLSACPTRPPSRYFAGGSPQAPAKLGLRPLWKPPQETIFIPMTHWHTLPNLSTAICHDHAGGIGVLD